VHGPIVDTVRPTLYMPLLAALEASCVLVLSTLDMAGNFALFCATWAGPYRLPFSLFTFIEPQGASHGELNQPSAFISWHLRAFRGIQWWDDLSGFRDKRLKAPAENKYFGRTLAAGSAALRRVGRVGLRGQGGAGGAALQPARNVHRPGVRRGRCCHRRARQISPSPRHQTHVEPNPRFFN